MQAPFADYRPGHLPVTSVAESEARARGRRGDGCWRYSGFVYKLAGGCIVEYSRFETWECSVELGTVVWNRVVQ
jgi:hypothetical protein